MKRKGVLSIEDTLRTHDGQPCDKSADLDDSTQGCDVWAHNLVNLHYSAEETAYPLDFQLWTPVKIDALEAGLTAAGVPLREHQYALKASKPKQGRQYLLQLWRRHQQQPAVHQL